MELSAFYKSVLDADRAPIVICDMSNTIVYMNPCAVERYAKRGGEKLIGSNILDCHNEKSRELILKVIEWFKKSDENNIIHTFKNPKENKDVYMVALRDGGKRLIGYYEKHEYRANETAKPYDFS